MLLVSLFISFDSVILFLICYPVEIINDVPFSTPQRGTEIFIETLLTIP